MFYNILQELKKFRRRAYKHVMLKLILPPIYKKYAKLPVDEQKVVFLEIRLPEISNSFKLLYDYIMQNYDMKINSHFLRDGFVSRQEHLRRSKEFIKDVATAKYIFVAEGGTVPGSVTIREETIVTQTWHGCGAFKKFGFSTAELIFGGTRKEMNKYPNYKNYTHVTVSSPEVIWAYEEAMNLKDQKGVVKPIGVSRTDIFYDEAFIEAAKAKLRVHMPQCTGKKVILYAPTFRGRVARAQAPDMLRIPMFKERLCEDYVLIIKHHPLVKERPEVPVSCLDFARDFTDDLSIEELLCAADICISDYSSLIYEYSIFEKPMIFFSYDLKDYFDWRGFYYNYDELAPGPNFTTNLEMIDYIEHIEERFDAEKVAAFREKFMCACDGHATERIADMVFEEKLESYRREIPLLGSFHHSALSEDYFEVYESQRRTMEDTAKRMSKLYQKHCSCDVVAGKTVVIKEGSKQCALEHVGEKLTEKGIIFSEFTWCKSDEDEMLKALAQAETVIVSEDNPIVEWLALRTETQVTRIGAEYLSALMLDEGFVKKATAKLQQICPQAKQKKVIFYYPTKRKELRSSNSPFALDYLLMNEYLKDDYMLLCCSKIELGSNSEEVMRYYPDFMKNMYGKIDVTELMAAADLMIGDYNKELHVFPRKGRRVLFYAPDYKIHLFQDDQYLEYEKYLPGRLCLETKDLIDSIKGGEQS